MIMKMVFALLSFVVNCYRSISPILNSESYHDANFVASGDKVDIMTTLCFQCIFEGYFFDDYGCCTWEILIPATERWYFPRMWYFALMTFKTDKHIFSQIDPYEEVNSNVTMRYHRIYTAENYL